MQFKTGRIYGRNKITCSVKIIVYKQTQKCYNKYEHLFCLEADFLDRVILHCDFNNFFASVACRDNPELIGHAVAVCGSEKERKGIVLAKNELAKAQGVTTAETVWKAKQKCPSLIIVPPDHKRYKYFSDEVHKIYLRFTDQVEKFSIDESWLDVTGSIRLFGDGKTIADTIRETVKNELGLTVSVGVSFNKIFAKMASDLKKPDATTVITADNYKDVLWKLPVKDMIGIGKSSENKLRSLGIFTIGDIAAADPVMLEKSMRKQGRTLWEYANGKENSPVEKFDAVTPPKSIGRSVTGAEDITDMQELHKVLLKLTEEVTATLRKWGFLASGVQVHLRTLDLQVTEMQCRLERPCCTTKTIEAAGMDLIKRHGGIVKPLRSVGIRVFGFAETDAHQFSLFDDTDEDNLKDEDVERSIDRIKERFGKESISRAATLKKPRH